MSVLRRRRFRPDGRRAGNARGAVTAEFAVAMPAVLLLLAMLLAGAAAGVTQLRLEEAARAGARALARGESATAVEGIVRTLAGASATAAVTADGEWLSVTVADQVGGPLGSTVPWTLTAVASTQREASVARLEASFARQEANVARHAAQEQPTGLRAAPVSGSWRTARAGSPEPPPRQASA